MVNHGSTMIKTLLDHGQPWLTMVQPCSSPRGVDLNVWTSGIMSDHGHLVFECGTDHGCLIMANHGW